VDILVLIPARSGSKRLPGKQLMKVGGASLLARTVEQALDIAPVERVVFSTDSAELMDAAVTLGLKEEPLRPSELAADETPTSSVIRYEARRARSEAGLDFDAVLLLQVTSPLRMLGDVVGALSRFQELRMPIATVYRDANPNPTQITSCDGGLTGKAGATGEAAGRLFKLNGAAYVIPKDMALDVGLDWGPEFGLFEMPRERSVDVDTLSDLEQARRVPAID
jgi:CMP-N-acetylneuraminic acid synthetase